MSYRSDDFYSPEAKRQVETMNAIRGQADLRYERMKNNPNWSEEYKKGYADAYWGLMHTLGEMSAVVSMQERARERAAKDS